MNQRIALEGQLNQAKMQESINETHSQMIAALQSVVPSLDDVRDKIEKRFRARRNQQRSTLSSSHPHQGDDSSSP